MTTEEILHSNLTDEQYAAVIDDSRNILCLACAGSGKSRTLAYKIAYLISKGEEPESIIAFTFTEKAAESIKRRVAEALRKFGLSENIVGAMFIGTLDAFCQKLLGDINAKYRQFDILDQNRLVLYVMSRQYKLGLKNGKGYFNRIKEFTDAWQTMHNENIDLKDIQHLVYPRFTRTVPPRGVITGKMHPNEAYEIIHNNDVRDEQIIEDVKNCVSAGRTPVVLSRYKDHSEKLYERLKSYADYVFLMTGNNSKKEHRKILEQMRQVNNDESMILVATGSLVGEGFDFPRLDTLFMATPVSFRGVVEQYAGRLNRDYAGKENVIIYDYVDNHIPMFDNMYMKRLKAYKQIGYELAGSLKFDKQAVNAIYDGDNYRVTFQKDLLDANKNIIISSPAISGQKVYELINMLEEKQVAGVQITIVTWIPDSYGFGDAAYWMRLHEDMRKAGFYIKTVEEYCDRFAVIDQEVVWYGNINLLAKDKIDDSIMRVMSKDIACELMEITFGDNDGKDAEYNDN